MNDYLEARLAELNRRRFSDGAPWVLVQPSGIFPLVGPVFRPGQNACWMCLADRMTRNREVKALLERREARCVAVSPLAQQTLGQSAIQLAAVEVAKAIATDFRTPLCDQIISFDLLGSTIVKHHVAARPQCPSCGRKKLRDPRRAPAPIELGAGGKVVMTSGGYRSLSPSATVPRFRRHVSPLTGVVSRLERIQADLPLNTNYYATHNFSGPAKTVHELRAGLSSGSFGKGSTAEQGEASALMEAIERYYGIFQGDEIRAKRRFTDFPSTRPFLQTKSCSSAKRNCNKAGRRRSARTSRTRSRRSSIDRQRSNGRRSGLCATRASNIFRAACCISFTGALPPSPRIPMAARPATRSRKRSSRGFLELVERDAYAIWWYNRLQRPELDLGQFDDAYVRDLQKQLAQTGRRLWVLDVTSDLGIPTFVAVTHWMQNGRENIEFGSGAHFDARIALLRALTELNQFLSLGLMGGGTGEKSSLDGAAPLRLQDHPYLTPSGNPMVNRSSARSLGISTRASR